MTTHDDPVTSHADDAVIRAEAADLDILTQVIAEAFHPLAPSLWLIADPDVRRDIFPPYFRLYVDHAMEHGVVQTNAERSAAALWIPTPAEHPAPSQEYTARLTAVTGPFASRFHTFDAALDEHHVTGVAHHHLAILGVRPDRQGRGIGTALLRAYHDLLDTVVAEPAFLEASDLRTRQIYLRHGYVDRGSPIQLPDGPKMYPMWRERRGHDGVPAGQGAQP